MTDFSRRKILRYLAEAGFVEVKGRGKGSHQYFRRDGCDESITVPHGKDISIGAYKSIMKTARDCIEKIQKRKP